MRSEDKDEGGNEEVRVVKHRPIRVCRGSLESYRQVEYEFV